MHIFQSPFPCYHSLSLKPLMLLAFSVSSHTTKISTEHSFHLLTSHSLKSSLTTPVCQPLFPPYVPQTLSLELYIFLALHPLTTHFTSSVLLSIIIMTHSYLFHLYHHPKRSVFAPFTAFVSIHLPPYFHTLMN